VQRKINSRLLHAKRRLTGETSVTTDVALARAADGRVQLELRAEVTDRLFTAPAGLGADVVATQASGRSVLVDADLLQVEQIAALADVHFVEPKPDIVTHASEERVHPHDRHAFHRRRRPLGAAGTAQSGQPAAHRVLDQANP